MAIKYISKYKVPLEPLKKTDHQTRVATLIWGDPVHVLGKSGAMLKVRARNQIGLVDPSAISDQGLLEIYVIDVGQGDGVLIKTPDDKWHLIDAGVPGKIQMTRKGAANFVRWKFRRDLRRKKAVLSNVIITHPDRDHYGGFLDILTGKLADGGKFTFEVENLYHNGLGHFKVAPKLGEHESGEVADFPYGYHHIAKKGTFITELLNGKNSFRQPPREFEGQFGELAELIGNVPNHVRRLSHHDKYLPGYGPGNGGAEIRVLGPVLERFNGKDGLRWLGSDSVTRNGHSVVLRVDYGKARILLGGDLNAKSQKLLLSYHAADEFEVDVAKGCHHGSEDIDLDFIMAVHARSTVISSGDNESYSHPRPVLLGASARYGREAVGGDGKAMAPLIYSTELARSIKLEHAEKARIYLKKGLKTKPMPFDPDFITVKPEEKWARYRSLKNTLMSFDLVYGLVNIRTDGEHILCATMEESSNDFDVKVFKAGVEAPAPAHA